MRRRSPTRALQKESLEDRRLTASLSSSIGAFTSGPQREVAIVRSIGPIEHAKWP